MASTRNVDVVVLGAGPAGYVAAIRLAQLGRKVTVIDRDEVGGVCLNRGCIPSKALIYAGSLYEKLSHVAEMGIEVKGAKLHLPKLMTWKESVVKKLTGGVAGLLKANGCELLSGDAKLTGPKALEVKKKDGSSELLQFQACVLATGSRPAEIPAFKVDQKVVLDSTGALALTETPESMLCIGGGYIGLELGSFYSKIGTKVTVVEAGTQLLGGVDPELTGVVQKKLQAHGVRIELQAKVQSLEVVDGKAKVRFQTSDGQMLTETFSKVLVTIGRTPNSHGLGLERAGVKLDSKGFVVVDERRATNVSGIYAIGDLAGQPLLAHKGSKEGIVAAEAIAGKKTIYDVHAMPAVIFTDPEIATVGLTEAEARAKGLQVMIGKFPFGANGRALSVGEPDGFVKIVGDQTTGKLLGVHIVGVEASNLIAEAALAIEMGAQVEDLALTVHAHPTLPETVMEAAEATLGHAIHIFQKKQPTSTKSATLSSPAR
jgi:dihydrolipoamide dehydrogenase